MPRRTIDSHPRRPYAYIQGSRSGHTHLEIDILDLGNYAVVGHTHVEADITDGKYRLLRRDGFSAVTARETLHVKGGTGIGLSFVDDAGEDETELTIDLAAALADLTDVTLSAPQDNFVLSFDSTGGVWRNLSLSGAGIAAASHTHPAADVTDFSTEVDARIALANVADLADVTISAIASNEMLQWNGSAWINQTFAELGLVVLSVVNTFTANQKITAANPTLTFKDTADSLDEVGPRWEDSTGTARWSFQHDGNDLYIFEHNGTPEAVVKFDLGFGRLEFPVGRRPGVEGNSGSTLGALSIGDEVIFSGDPLDSFDAITLTAIASGELLQWNGAVWINQTLAEAGIEVTGHTHVKADITDFAHTHLEADVTDLQAYILGITGEPFGDLSDVVITTPTNNELMKFNGANWINVSAAAANLSEIGHVHTLDSGSNVTITTIAANEILRWSGSAWINRTLAEAGISATGHTHVQADITDFGGPYEDALGDPASDGFHLVSTAAGVRSWEAVPAGSSAYSLFRRDGFVAMTARETFHLIGGQNILVTALDDAGNDETDITIAVDLTGLDADTLDTFEAAAFPRKGEDAVVLGAWHFDDVITLDSAGTGKKRIIFDAADLSFSRDMGFHFSHGGSSHLHKSVIEITTGDFLWQSFDTTWKTVFEIIKATQVMDFNERPTWDGSDLALLSEAGDSTGPLSGLTDVTITSIAANEMLHWSGSAWINRTFAELGIGSISGTTVVSGAWNFTTATLKIGGSAGSPDLEITDDSSRDPRLKAPGGKMTLETLGSTTPTGDGLYLDDGGTNNAKVAGIKNITATATAPTGDYPYGTLHLIY